MAVFAATGAFLSFFHQGSLGGVAGVLFSRPFSYREGVYVWTWTFFKFTGPQLDYGPCFTLTSYKAYSTKSQAKKLVADNVVEAFWPK